jgi:hypothetical protein
MEEDDCLLKQRYRSTGETGCQLAVPSFLYSRKSVGHTAGTAHWLVADPGGSTSGISHQDAVSSPIENIRRTDL